MLHRLFIGVLLALCTSGAFAATDYPSGYTKCAQNTGATCSFSGTRQVALGKAGSFVYGTFTGSVACSSSNFPSNSYPSSAWCSYAPTSTSSSASSKASSASSSKASSSTSSKASSSTTSTAACDLPSNLSWTASAPLISPKNGAASIKDPTIVNYNGKYHVFATIYNSGYKSTYLNFYDLNNASSATQTAFAPAGSSTVAPQVFYFAPQNKWYLITQWGGRFSTNTDINNVSGWTTPQALLSGEPSNALDFWVICNESNCYLYFSRDDGKLYMSKTSVANFPKFSGYTTVMSGDKNVLFEASNVYKLKGLNKYLLMVEGWQSGPRFFRAWTSSSLDGPWTAYKTSESAPFAGSSNVSYPGGKWSNDISHGEMIRAGYDQKMEIDACKMQFLFQGHDPSFTGDYNLIPYKLGIITAK
jgi:hypothetical protein